MWYFNYVRRDAKELTKFYLLINSKLRELFKESFTLIKVLQNFI